MSDYIKDDKHQSIINLQSVREKSNKKGFLGIIYIFTPIKFVFRYNTRKNNESDRFNLLLNNIENKLTYKELING